MAKVILLNKQHPYYQEDLSNILSISGIEQIRGKRFLITGASGLIGLCLIDALMRYNTQGADISIYAVGRSKEKAALRLGEYFLDSHFHFVEQDVRLPLPQSLNVDYIIPLASNTHPLAYSKYPIETIEINVKGSEYALQKAMECGATVLYPSTVEIYGHARNNDVFTEDYTGSLNLSTSRSCYTESKRVSEALCQSYLAEKAVEVKIVRLSRVFGPTMLMDDTKASSQFIKKALLGEDVVLKSNGEQFFSYTYVADAVAAMLYVLIHGEAGVAYNISNKDCCIHLKEFAEICAEFCGKRVIFEIPDEEEKKGYSVALQAVMDNHRINSIGWQESYRIDDAIKRTINCLS